VFQEKLDGIMKAAEQFEADAFVKSQVDTARSGGYRFDALSELSQVLNAAATRGSGAKS